MVDQVSLNQGLVSNNNMLAAPVNVTAPAANNQSLFQLPDPSVNNYANGIYGMKDMLANM